MTTIRGLAVIAIVVSVSEADAKKAILPPSLAEITRFEQSTLNKAKGEPLKQWYGGRDATTIPQDATASASGLSCVRMPAYEIAGSSIAMWKCDYNFELKSGTMIFFKGHESQQLSQDVKSRTLEIPPPQVALPR